MLRYLKVFLCLILFVLAFSIKAQPYVDLLNLKYQNFPSIDIDKNTNINTRQIIADLFIPLELKNKDVIIFGSSFDKLVFKNEGDSSISSNIYAVSLQAGIIKQWKNDNWSTMFLLIPKISSDFEELSAKHYQMGGVVLFTYKKHNRLKYKFGLYYNREFFGNFFMPLAGIDWVINERLNIFGVLPGSMNMEYKVSKHFYAGIGYKSITASYRISDSSNNFYVREGHKFWGHNQLKINLNFYPVKYIVLFTELGHTFWRRYDLYNQENDSQSFHSIYNKFNDGIFFNLGIALRIRIEEKQAIHNSN